MMGIPMVDQMYLMKKNHPCPDISPWCKGKQYPIEALVWPGPIGLVHQICCHTMENNGALLIQLLWVIFVNDEHMIPSWCFCFPYILVFRDIFKRVVDVVIHGELYLILIGEPNGNS